MESSSSPESPVAPTKPGLSVVVLMIAIAFVVLGIVFVLALLDMRGGGSAPPASGASERAHGSAQEAQ